MPKPDSYWVMILDMGHHQDADHETVVAGFPTFAAAREYARRRTRDSLEDLRQDNQTAQQLRTLWATFGEDILAFGPDAGERYAGASEIDVFIASPASADERDWQAIERQVAARMKNSI
jgi:hypothetical protein